MPRDYVLKVAINQFLHLKINIHFLVKAIIYMMSSEHPSVAWVRL